MFADAEQSAGVDAHPGGRGEASRRKRGQVKRDGKEIPERGQAQRRETVWLARGPAGEPSAIVRDVTGDESDEVVGEGSRSP